MKKWNKIISDKSNKITNINIDKDFKYFDKEMGGYGSNQYYKDKKTFFEFYFRGRYIIWVNYLKNNLKSGTKTLSIGSGNCINEVSLISNNFDIVCSDLEIPQSYNALKKLFNNFDYLKLNILKDSTNSTFDNIFSTSV